MSFGLFLTGFAPDIANTYLILPKHKRPIIEETGRIFGQIGRNQQYSTKIRIRKHQ